MSIKKEVEQFVNTRVDTLLHKHLLDQRKIYLWGAVEDNTAKQLVEEMNYLSALSKEPIHFYINSLGGIVTSGYAVYDTMQYINAPVYTYCIGFAASMGSILLSGGEKGHRYIFPRAEVMIHQPSMGGFQGNYADIEIHAQQILKTKEIAARILADNCGQPIDKIKKDFDRDYWMDAEEAISYGIVDRMITV